MPCRYQQIWLMIAQRNFYHIVGHLFWKPHVWNTKFRLEIEKRFKKLYSLIRQWPLYDICISLNLHILARNLYIPNINWSENCINFWPCNPFKLDLPFGRFLYMNIDVMMWVTHLQFSEMHDVGKKSCRAKLNPGRWDSRKAGWNSTMLPSGWSCGEVCHVSLCRACPGTED